MLKPMAGPASPPSFPACPSLGCGSSAGFSLALSASVGLNRQAAAQSLKSLSSCSDVAPVASQALGPEDGKAGCPTVYSQGACHVGAFQGVAQDGPRLGRSADGGAVQGVQFRKQDSGPMRKVPSLWLSQAPGPSESQSHQEHGSARGYILLRAAMGGGVGTQHPNPPEPSKALKFLLERQVLEFTPDQDAGLWGQEGPGSHTLTKAMGNFVS